MNDSINISKRDFWRYVNRKFRKLFHHYHIYNIINILFDEMIKDLKSGKTINIFNFGKLRLQQNMPRKHFDVVTRQVEISKSNNIMKFDLSSKIKNKVRQHLDLSKTLNHES